MMIRTRLNNDLKKGVGNVQWHNYIFPVLLTYNSKNEHRTTGMTPIEAAKEDKQPDVKAILEIKAKRNRQYPALAVGDRVKIMLKYDKFHKEHNSKFSDITYQIEGITEKHGLKLYTVNNRERLRNEIMKV